MAQQALQYTDVHQGEEVLDVQRGKDGPYRVSTTSNQYETKVIIVATGASHTKLSVPGEARFFGRGVSYCATCDGYFFKDGKKVIMVGGGNTAATEALYLDSIGVDVTIVHRRAVLRAEDRLRKNIEERGIPIIWDTVVEEISGENMVTSVKLRNVKNNAITDMAVDGVFVAIGYDPVNELAVKIGLDLTEEGYIKVDEGLHTSMPGIYAAGDITGGIKQIVTAVGQGSVAAINAFEDMMKPYWKQEKK
jgi:thioredoxin reductase (NADPH)